jgi:arylformamidase
MEILDVSVPIRPGMTIWPGDPAVEVQLAAAIADGAPANVTQLALGTHTGTHVDAPVHFFDGAGGVEALPLEALVGPCVVVDATTAAGDLGPEALADLAPGTKRVLFKTPNSELWARDDFVEDFVALSNAGAEDVVRRGILLVGIDYLSIGGSEAHRTLLRAGVVPLESLDLRAVEPGAYTLLCLPLKLVGADGAPARTLLVRG